MHCVHSWSLNMPLREVGLPFGVSEPLILKKQAIYSLPVAVVSGCLPLFAELAQQIGGVAQRAEGVAKSLRSSEIRTLSVFSA